LNRAASDPAEIVTVADSETLIVAALAELKMFSATEKDEDEVKVGAVVSGVDVKKVNVIVCDVAPHVGPLDPPQFEFPIKGLRLYPEAHEHRP
jgi:hypothetical protein